MKIFTSRIGLLPVFFLFFLFFALAARAQSVLNPADPVVTYDPNHPPVIPPSGQIGKWVRTKRLNWNTDQYKAYYYKGSAFRLLFPKSYNPGANDGKTYPMIIMFHGAGESAPVTDDEYCMFHGGLEHLNAVNSGKFDGYVFFMQSGAGWSDPKYTLISEIIDYMIANNKLDPFRVSVHGLSAGGEGAWNMAVEYPTYVAGLLPMSGTQIGYKNTSVVQSLKYTPIWDFQGGLDGSPAPATSIQVYNAFVNAGGNYKHTVYPDLGHITWDRAYAEPDFFPFMVRAHKANPWPLGGKALFCPGETINVTLGVTAGFTAYQWRKNGVLIPGAAGNTLQVTSEGTYDCRLQRGNLWSPWSPVPIVVKYRGAPVPPAITLASSPMSNVLPTPDSVNAVLSVPATYASYQWLKVGSGTTLSTTNTLVVSKPGDYTVTITEGAGCIPGTSAPFKVVDANGPNKPDPVIGLTATTMSRVSLRLQWIDNPNPAYDETNFEVYMSTSQGGKYKLVSVQEANVLADTITGLSGNTTYYFKVRAVNNSGASALSAEASGKTSADSKAPTAPTNLVSTGTTSSSVSLSWTASTDDVGVTGYDVYIDGRKSYTTTQTTVAADNLMHGRSYRFAVRARDLAGNVSPFSNEISAEPLRKGLDYKYYTGTWTSLPDFGTLTPVARGQMPNVALTPRTQDDHFAFMWTGFITLPSAGTYYFRLNSDDGSRLYLGARGDTASPYTSGGSPTLVVNNDGKHAATEKTSVAMNLQAGVYPIAITYFEFDAGQSITVSWRTPSDTTFTPIPDIAFAEGAFNNGTAPAAPSGLSATAAGYNSINLAWTDNSNNETGFEIWRSTSPNSGFVPVGQTGANIKSFTDSLSLSPGTTYYYQLRATGQYGQSAFIPTGTNVVKATTGTLPSLPVKSTGLVANATSPTSIRVTWADNATNETGYQILRKAATNANYILLSTLPANSTFYQDDGLYPNTIFSYIVRPFNAAGYGDFGNTDTAMTLDNPPVLPAIGDKYGRWGTTISVPVNATDPDRETLTVTTPALPVFGGYTSTGNGTGVLTFTPSQAQQGTYPVTVTVTDQHKGSVSSTFRLIVNGNYNPVMGAVNNVTVSEGQTATVNLSATDADAGDALSWSFTGLPSFATVTSSGRTAAVQLAPGYTDNGTYNVTAIVSDGHNGTDTRSFVITVTDVVHSDDHTAPARPRDLTGILAGSQVQLTWTDAAYNETGYEVWRATGRTGPYSLLNAGGTPANAISYMDGALSGYTTYYYAVRAVNAVGKSPFSDTVSVTTANTAPILAGVADVNMKSQQVLDVQVTATDNAGDGIILSGNNLPAFAMFTDKGGGKGVLHLAPGYVLGTFTGASISATDNKGATSTTTFTVKVSPADPTAPSRLRATGLTRTSIGLTWSGNAPAATGYEVWRSTSAGGDFSLMATLGSNVTTYTDNNLTAGVLYYYKVRAKLGPSWSGYSNIVGASGLMSTVYINFNGTDAAPPPWNNTMSSPMDGKTYPLSDDLGYPSGERMTVVGNGFSGVNSSGMNTGNNSGIYPDNVIKQTWYVDAPAVGKVQIDGLDQAMAYNLTFFASRIGDPGVTNRTTNYTANGQSVQLNAINNIDKTIQAAQVSADQNGAILVSIEAVAPSRYGYIGALTLQGYLSDTLGEVPASSSTDTTHHPPPPVDTPGSNPPQDTTKVQVSATAYPNPFTDDVILTLSTPDGISKVGVAVFDISGKAVLRREISQVPRGTTQYNVGLNRSLGRGVYLLQVRNGDTGSVKVIQLLRR